MSALDRLKCIQNNFRQQWHGINCEISGRPGEYRHAFPLIFLFPPFGSNHSVVVLNCQLAVFLVA